MKIIFLPEELDVHWLDSAGLDNLRITNSSPGVRCIQWLWILMRSCLVLQVVKVAYAVCKDV